MNGFGAHCFVHESREAVALCLECRHSYCRECVVDHDGRLICAACLGRLQKAAAASTGRLRRALSYTSVMAALLLCWIVFYMAGRAFMLTEPPRHSFDSSAREQRP